VAFTLAVTSLRVNMPNVHDMFPVISCKRIQTKSAHLSYSKVQSQLLLQHSTMEKFCTVRSYPARHTWRNDLSKQVARSCAPAGYVMASSDSSQFMLYTALIPCNYWVDHSKYQ
jgi:hypothetical protein